jgi:hypothetical protein
VTGFVVYAFLSKIKEAKGNCIQNLGKFNEVAAKFK